MTKNFGDIQKLFADLIDLEKRGLLPKMTEIDAIEAHVNHAKTSKKKQNQCCVMM
jgi:hypothetical protein